MYFKNFDQIYYDFELSGEKRLVIITDILKNVRYRKEVLSNVTIYDEYDVKDGETPEIVAELVYGNANYHWIIMLANDIYNYADEWPLSTYDLEQHIKQKYGENNVYSTHHYEDLNGYIVDEFNVNAQPISNYQYEESLNESKRRIKLISKDLIYTILKNFNNL